MEAAKLFEILELQLMREPRKAEEFFIPIARNPLKSIVSEK
jgi:hypothetical protein